MTQPARPATAPDAVDGPSTPAVEPALVDGVDVETVARAVRACAGVSDLYSGRFDEIGSYLPGRRVVAGVQVADGALTVQIRARWGFSPRDLFAQVSGVTATLRLGRSLQLVIADIDDDPSLTRSDAASAAAASNAPASSAVPAAVKPAATTHAPAIESSSAVRALEPSPFDPPRAPSPLESSPS